MSPARRRNNDRQAPVPWRDHFNLLHLHFFPVFFLPSLLCFSVSPIFFSFLLSLVLVSNYRRIFKVSRSIAFTAIPCSTPCSLPTQPFNCPLPSDFCSVCPLRFSFIALAACILLLCIVIGFSVAARSYDLRINSLEPGSWSSLIITSNRQSFYFVSINLQNTLDRALLVLFPCSLCCLCHPT